MTQVLATATGLFRDRDLFIHDGSKLRRFRVSASLQLLAFVLLAALVLWSSYAVTRLIAPAPGQVQASAMVTAPGDENYSAKLAELTAETERRVLQIEQRQMALAAALRDADIDAASLRKLGFLPSTDDRDGRGGPFESAGNATFKALFNSWKKLESLQDGVISVPSDKPVKTAAFTSGYGVRSDPFKGGSAMHAGIDLSGPTGTPIYATADGVVITAGYNNGGYGNLVKIEHGRGIETRYGHLASMSVSNGQRVTRGQVIGRMGSTGRSTGSHLHYEVRIDGRAVNPIPFMKSTDYVLAMQKKANAAPMESLALGGPSAAKR
jgi:murein DD-endopeptidase MepM/ murein hydrolase activator NlpD